MKPMITTPPRPGEILLIEDDDGDAYLTEKAFTAGPLSVRVRRVRNGEEALRYMRAQAGYENRPRPDLILLDLNLPKLQGGKILEILKNNRDWKRIPVVILTSSEAETDIIQSYTDHANSYMVKPGTPDIFYELAQTCNSYWFRHVRLSKK